MKNNLKTKKILAIIPARSGSKGLRNKNIRKFNKKPLIYWIQVKPKNLNILVKQLFQLTQKKLEIFVNH